VTFNEVLSQTIAMLQQHGRVSYRALKRQFALDDPFLDDRQYEIITVQQRAAPPLPAPAPAAPCRQALALAEALGMRPLQARCHHGLGTLYATVGQREQARVALTTALEMYRAMEMPFWLPQTEAALAQVAGR